MIEIIFYLLIADAVGANLMAWGGGSRWWHQHVPTLAKHFPLTKGWTTYYLLLVLLIGYIIFY